MLSAVSGRGAYANLLLATLLRERGLRGQDAALATELVYGTLRNRGSYDEVIRLCADRGLDQIDPPVREVLRLGAHQLLGMRIKPHAAVATTVDLAVEVAGRRPSGFVNAVLRRVTTHDLEAWTRIAAPSRETDLVGHLSVRYSHPRWIVMAFAEALGEKVPGPGQSGELPETEAALAADRDRPVVTLAAVPGLASADELIAGGATTARWSPYGAYLAQGDPGALPAVRQHRAGVQDEASQLAVLALTRARTTSLRPESAAGVGPEPAAGVGPEPCAPQGTGSAEPQDAGSGELPDRAWLDLCAGPGGKARLLAGLAAERAAVLLAVDSHEHRARLTASAVGGIPVAAAVTADGTAPAWPPGTFDRVLADVPCTGLGSLRRRPDARWRRSPDGIAALAGLQRALLAAAIESARLGGVVAYVTCSPHVAETRDVITDVLADHPGVRVLDAPALLPEVPGLRCPEPYERFAQFWPHRQGTDAIFIALLRKDG